MLCIHDRSNPSSLELACPLGFPPLPTPFRNGPVAASEAFEGFLASNSVSQSVYKTALRLRLAIAKSLAIAIAVAWCTQSQTATLCGLGTC